MSWESTGSVSSSFALPLFEPSSSWSCMFVVYVCCWIVLALAGIVMLMWVVGGIEEVAFVRSLSSLLVLVDWRYVLISICHLLNMKMG